MDPTESTPPVTPDPKASLLAGKYETPEKLVEGIANGLKKLGTTPDTDRLGIGEGKAFKTNDEAVAYYKSIQSGISAASMFAAKKPPDPTPAVPPTPPATTNDSIQDLLVGTPTETALDLDTATMDDIRKFAGITPERETAMAKSFKETGKLSDQDYAAFKKIGVPRVVADQIVGIKIAEAVATANATASTLKAKAVAMLGGADKLATVMDWARKGGVDADIAKANDDAIRANPAMYTTVVAAYKAMYEAKAGDGKQPATGNRSVTGSGSGRLSHKELKNLNARAAAGDRSAAEELGRAMDAGRLGNI